MNVLEYIVALALIILLLLLVNPFMLWMPSMLQMTALLIIAVLALLYAGFIMREKGGDERDLLHRMIAGRAAFLTSIGVLTLALIVQGAEHAIDPWISFTLIAVIVAKIAARAWARRYH